MIKRLLGTGALMAAVATAGAQVFLDADHNILVPPSSIPIKGRYHSDYVVNLAKPQMPHVATDAGIHPMGTIISGYYPADIRTAYRLPDNGGTGVIAIVDAFDDPTALSDFNFFSKTFNLPQETSKVSTASTNKVFQVVYASGQRPPTDTGWAGEIALDIEWAHSVAPNAKIVLVEAASSADPDINVAISVAKNLVGVHEVSMSFGSVESPGDAASNPLFEKTGVTFFAAAGDTANEHDLPGLFPNVISCGGTAIVFNNGVVTETTWNQSGGGPSVNIPRPSFQNVIASILGTKRGSPDISAIADPNTGVAVYDTTGGLGWNVVGGTSLATPVCAAIANVRGAFSASSETENARNYLNLRGPGFRDITAGVTGIYHAVVGWDFITGCGSPVGFLPQTEANPIGAVVSHGVAAGGVLSALTSVNGVTFNTLSTPYSLPVGEFAGDSITVHFSGPSTAFSKVYICVTGSTSAAATLDVKAYNVVTHAYETLGSYPSTAVPASKTILLTAAQALNYFDASHNVHLYVDSHTPGHNTVAHTLKLDQVAGYGLP